MEESEPIDREPESSAKSERINKCSDSCVAAEQEPILSLPDGKDRARVVFARGLIFSVKFPPFLTPVSKLRI